MSTLDIKRLCGKCKGMGLMLSEVDGVPGPEVPCDSCAGEGAYEDMVLDTTELQADINKCLHRLKKIMDKLEIGD
jgi:excinuclease UvrABC ATPase subunit